MSTLAEAYKEAENAYIQAYGQVHDTPDGKYCWMGRLDRAYMILADKQDDPQTKVKLEKLEALVKSAYALADEKYNAYHLMAVSMGKNPQEIKIECACPCCKRQATFRIVATMRKCENIGGIPGGLVVEDADRFQADADKVGIPVQWVHFDLKTHEWKEGRGV